jgi:hypothetical protein
MRRWEILPFVINRRPSKSRCCYTVCTIPNLFKSEMQPLPIAMPFKLIIFWQHETNYFKCSLLYHISVYYTQWTMYEMLLPYFPAHKTHFFPQKCDLNSTCVLRTECKCYFQTYKYPYIYYTTSLSWDSEDDFSGSDDNFLGFYGE